MEKRQLENRQWLRTLQFLESKYHQVRNDTHRTYDGVLMRAALLLSTTAVFIGILNSLERNLFSIISLAFACLAGILSVIVLWRRRGVTYDLKSIRENLHDLASSAQLPSEIEIYSRFYQQEEDFDDETSIHIRRMSTVVSAAFTSLLVSLLSIACSIALQK